MRTRRAMTVGLLVIALGSAWVRAQTVTPPPGYPALGAAPIVTLQSTGAEPRRALRYVFTKGQQENMSIDTTIGMTMDMAGMSMPPMQLPTMHMVGTAVVTDVSAAGDASLAVSFTDVTLENDPNADPTLAGMLQAGLADVKSLASTSVVSTRGFMSDTKMDLSRVTNPQMAQALGAMSSSMNSMGMGMPMPEEPVGAGARWTVRQAVPSSGFKLFQDVQVELTAVDEHSCSMGVKLTQTAPPQAVQNPSLPPGVQATLDRFEGSGSGTVALRFSSLVPTSHMTGTNSTTISVDAGTGVQQVGVKMTLVLKVAPAK